MKKRIIFILLVLIIMLSVTISCICLSNEKVSEMKYKFPPEDNEHEGTWLNWPHHYTYGKGYRKEIEGIWIEIVEALHADENIHIIAYNETEKTRIKDILVKENIDMSKIDFVIAKSNDVWARDTGPIFVHNKEGALTIADFAFDGWGEKVPYKYDDIIPQVIAKDKRLPIINIPDFVLEGGSVELDGNGTALICKSSVISENRNPELNIYDAEKILAKYLGVTSFIWLDGVVNEDITDAHIDGIAKFYNNETIITVSENDFFELYESITENDYNKLITAKNSSGKNYKIIELPLTKKNAKGVDYKGNYINYYIGNGAVLVPIYNDENDELAIEILADLYPYKEIVPIDVTALYKYGGMIHCITQQQPLENS